MLTVAINAMNVSLMESTAVTEVAVPATRATMMTSTLTQKTTLGLSLMNLALASDMV